MSATWMQCVKIWKGFAEGSRMMCMAVASQESGSLNKFLKWKYCRVNGNDGCAMV